MRRFESLYQSDRKLQYSFNFNPQFSMLNYTKESTLLEVRVHCKKYQ